MHRCGSSIRESRPVYVTGIGIQEGGHKSLATIILADTAAAGILKVFLYQCFTCDRSRRDPAIGSFHIEAPVTVLSTVSGYAGWLLSNIREFTWIFVGYYLWLALPAPSTPAAILFYLFAGCRQYKIKCSATIGILSKCKLTTVCFDD